MRILVLSGGASLGADQIGRIKALWESGRHWDAIVGTSVGAVNAMAISYVGVEKTVEAWKSIESMWDILGVNMGWPWRIRGVFNFDPLKRFMLKHLKDAPRPLIPHYSVCTNLALDRTEIHEATGEKLRDLDYVLASSAVAGLESSVKEPLYDGGHKDSVAIQWCLEEFDSPFLDVIATEPFWTKSFKTWKPSERFPLGSIALRGVNLMAREVMRNDLNPWRDHPLVKLHLPSKPIEGLGGINYSAAAIQAAILNGYEDMKRILGDG